MKKTLALIAALMVGAVAQAADVQNYQLDLDGNRIAPVSGDGSTTQTVAVAGSVDVFFQDQTSKPFDFFFTQLKGAPTTVAVATAVDDLSVDVASTNGMAVGDYFGLFNADSPTDNRAYLAEITDITGVTVTLDTPIDFAFQVGDTAAVFSRNMNVSGTPASPQIFSIQVGPNATQSIDITRIMIKFLTDAVVDLSKFGDIEGGLTYGCVLRRTDGIVHNIWNVKTNGEIANLCFDYNPYLSTNPSQGQNGALFRYTFAGADKHGVTIRLDPGDELQLIIQDDLTDITQFTVIAEGHYVVD